MRQLLTLSPRCRIFKSARHSHHHSPNKFALCCVLIETASKPTDWGSAPTSTTIKKTDAAHPIATPPYRQSQEKRQQTQQLVDEFLEQGLVQTSHSPRASPVFLVQKKNGDTRFCVDYRKLNAVTERDVYPLPRIDDSLAALEGAQFFTCLDLKSGGPLPTSNRRKYIIVAVDYLTKFAKPEHSLV